MLIRFRPFAAIHRQQRELGLAHTTVSTFPTAAPAADVSENTPPPARGRPRADALRRGARARCPATDSTAAPRQPRSAASFIICSGPSAQITLRNMARADSNDAAPSSGHQVERSSFGDRGPALALRRVAGQHRDPAREHRERRIGRDTRVAERRDPPLDGRHLAGVVRGQHQRRHQLDASVPVRRVQQVFERQRRGPVRLVPVGRAQVQLRDDIRFGAPQLAEQELSEQRVIAVPRAPTIERDQERVRRLQVPELRVRARSLRGSRRTAAH